MFAEERSEKKKCSLLLKSQFWTGKIFRFISSYGSAPSATHENRWFREGGTTVDHTKHTACSPLVMNSTHSTLAVASLWCSIPESSFLPTCLQVKAHLITVLLAAAERPAKAFSSPLWVLGLSDQLSKSSVWTSTLHRLPASDNRSPALRRWGSLFDASA